MKTLIVDDELTSRMKMKVILSLLGEIVLAENGKKAIDLFIKAYQENNPFDLITLDIGMNDLSGVEVLAAMRKYEEKLPIKEQSKIIMVTSHSNKPVVIDSFVSGCNDYIIKPFHKNTVFEKLEQIGRRTNDPKFFVLVKKENNSTREETSLTNNDDKMTAFDEKLLDHPEHETSYISHSEDDNCHSDLLYTNPDKVFDLLFIDNYTFQFFKIKDENGNFFRPHLVEIFDRGSKFIFMMECYSSANQQTAIDLLNIFISKAQLPKQKIRLCPNRVKDYFHLKQPVSELNNEYATPGGFHLDLIGPNDNVPGNKVNLKSDFQILHALEKNIIKQFEDRIFKKEKITSSISNESPTTVTYLNICLDEIKQSRLIETYRNIHNSTEMSPHLCNGMTLQPWIPNEKMQKYMSIKEKMIFNL